MDAAAPATKTELNLQRSSLTSQNELNNHLLSITNEKAALCNEIRRSDSAGSWLLADVISV